MATDLVEIIEQLNEAKARGLTVFIDNDHIGAHDEDADEAIVDAHPYDVMRALLANFGLKAESV